MASKGSSGIEVVSSNSPAIPAFFHPLVMIGTAFADVNRTITVLRPYLYRTLTTPGAYVYTVQYIVY